MNRGPWTDVALPPWSDDDLPLLRRTTGDAAMNEHLGGPEPPEMLAWRHERYSTLANSGEGRMFVIVAGPAAESVERARAEWRHRSVHAFPAVENLPSNAVCRQVGFELSSEVGFEFPPGTPMRSNDWRLVL